MADKDNLADVSGDMEESGEEDETMEGKEDMEEGVEAFVELPPEVQKRVKALKKVQVEVTKIEAQFYAEMHALECKYLPKYQPLFEKRLAITSGKYEPTEDECDFHCGSDSEADITDNVASIKLEGEGGENQENEKREKVSGIPDFWLTIFRNVEMLDEMVESHDEPILRHLQDIKVTMSEKPMGFTLDFHFSPNEFFTNTVLSKTYEMKCEVETEHPFSFEGPEIVKCRGCTIDWNKGKNVTVVMVRKKQKHKQKGTIRTVSKPMNVPSFFTFFSPPDVPEDPEAEVDDETRMRITNDFEVGQYIRERIVPRAVLYFTGEALEDEDYDEEEEEEEEGDDEEDDDEDEAPPARGQNRGRGRGGRKNVDPSKNPECKQQ